MRQEVLGTAEDTTKGVGGTRVSIAKNSVQDFSLECS